MDRTHRDETAIGFAEAGSVDEKQATRCQSILDELKKLRL